MAYPPRIDYPGALHHVTSRGAARAPIYSDTFDREIFYDLLDETVQRFGWRCHAYCLMTNHYHLLIETPAANLTRGMQRLNCRFAKLYNRRHGRKGHLFESRYAAILVERDAHLLELARYVVLNPVRAGACGSPGEWPWSSYRPTAGDETPPSFLTVDWLLAQLASRPATARVRYRAFVSEAPDRCPWSDLRGPGILGTSAFARRTVGDQRTQSSMWRDEASAVIRLRARLAGRRNRSDETAQVPPAPGDGSGHFP